MKNMDKAIDKFGELIVSITKNTRQVMQQLEEEIGFIKGELLRIQDDIVELKDSIENVEAITLDLQSEDK